MQLALRHLSCRTGDGNSEAEGGQPCSSKPELAMPVTVPAAESATVAASSEHKLGHLPCTDWQLEMSSSCCDYCQSHSGASIPISQDQLALPCSAPSYRVKVSMLLRKTLLGCLHKPVCTRNATGWVGPNLHQLTALSMSPCTVTAEARSAECPTALQLLLLLLLIAEVGALKAALSQALDSALMSKNIIRALRATCGRVTGTPRLMPRRRPTQFELVFGKCRDTVDVSALKASGGNKHPSDRIVGPALWGSNTRSRDTNPAVEAK